MRFRLTWTAIVLVVATSLESRATEFNILDYGATADDSSDDTLAIRDCFEAAHEAGGGTVLVPAGTYLISRQASESPILELPSRSLIRGEGPASTLKFDEGRQSDELLADARRQ